MSALFMAVLMRDLRLAARRRIESLLPLVFFVVAVSLFPRSEEHTSELQSH